MVTHSSILAWEIRQTEEPGTLQSMGLQKSQTQLKKTKKNYTHATYNVSGTGIGALHKLTSIILVCVCVHNSYYNPISTDSKLQVQKLRESSVN